MVATLLASLRTSSRAKDLNNGINLHAGLLKTGLVEENSYVADALVSMYAKCGALKRAKKLHSELPARNVFSWTALIAGYAQHGYSEDALDSFKQMQLEGIAPDAVTFTYILKACGSIGAVEKGKQLHHEISKLGLLGKDSVLGNALVDMYAKCGALSKAARVLEQLPVRDVFSWNALISGNSNQGNGQDALDCYQRMQQEGISPDAVTFSCVLKACGNIKATETGEKLHDEVAKRGLLVKDVVLGNSLVDMYVKCGAFGKARRVLEELPTQDVVSWSALIAGYAQQGQGEEALNCYELMQSKGLSPDVVTFMCALKACGSIGAVDEGGQIHDELTKRGLMRRDNIELGNALVDMYAKCGALTKAAQVLEELPVRDVFSWTALIGGYAEQDEGEEALGCFKGMKNEGIEPNAVTYSCLLKACGSIRAREKGEQIHEEICRQGLVAYNAMLGGALVDMYSKCGALGKALHVLEELPVEDVVSWSAVIAGYVQGGQGDEALYCFERMQLKGHCPDAMTFTYILKACTNVGAVEKAEHVHNEIAQQGLLEKDVVLGTALVDMYAKLGALSKAQQVLESLPIQSAVSWSALMAGYAQQGESQLVIECFEKILHKGFSPDPFMFSSVLHACSHAGLVHEGESYFADMKSKYGINPDPEHYACIIDLLGRAGHLDKVVALTQKIQCSDCSIIWCALLHACRKWRDINVGRWAFKHAIQLEKDCAAPYVLMVNIYADAGMQEDA